MEQVRLFSLHHTVPGTILTHARAMVNLVRDDLKAYPDKDRSQIRIEPLLKDMRGLPDFEFSAQQKLDDQQFSFYRTAAAGEWSK